MKNLKQLTLVSALIAASSLGAQENVGSVVGTVRDASGAAVAGALVRISGPSLLQPRETTTDANGRYSFRLILPGQTRVQASKQGLVGSAQTFNVMAGTTLTVDLTMRPMTVATEEVEVLGGTENPIIDKTETKVSSTFTVAQLFSNPAGGVGVYGALYLAPGVSGSTAYARIRGGTSGQTMYSINGIVMRDPEVGQGRQYETVLDDLIQDVQVVQNPINAKYGFTSSGSVNITTKTGTNKFEGSFRVLNTNYSWNSLVYFGSPNRWSENEWNNPSYTPMGSYGWYDWPVVVADNNEVEYNVTLSGPIWKDRITFIYGGRFQAKNYSPFTYTNVLGNSPETWRTYLPGFQNGDNKLVGPNPSGGPAQERFAGYLWDRNPIAPNAIVSKTFPGNFTFNQYKVFFQITPDHQVELLYSDEGYNSFSTPATPDTSVVSWNTAKRPMKGVNYRGIFGANAVVNAQWANRSTTVDFPKGPDDTIFYQAWQNNAPSALLASNIVAGVSQLPTGGAYSYGAIREVENWALDVNYIWDAHNFDAGIQRINERSTTGGYGIRDRAFWTPGMRYDGTYMVWNPFAADSPLKVNQDGATLEAYGYPSAGFGGSVTLAQAQENWVAGVLGGTRVPYRRQYSGMSDEEIPHDSQTTSFYANDNWTYNDNFAVSFGLRFEKSLVTDQRGTMAESMTINPRLRLQYDLFGDNRHVFSFAFTQANGTLYRAAMGSFAASSKTAVNKRYIWNQGASAQPYFVEKDEFKKLENYGYYYSYANSVMAWKVDPDLKPEQTTNFDFMYRRAFSQGGYFRASLIYNLLTTALFGELRDEELEMKDPSGAIPLGLKGVPENTYEYVRYLYNRADRGRHYAGLEMEWMMPLVTKSTWRLNWFGNWTIAKTTGNYIFEESNQSGNTEGNTVQYYDQLVDLGIPREMVDPWGESNTTPRHRMRSWVTFSHGDRGGIITELTLAAAWESGTYTDATWTYNLPADTWKVNQYNGNPNNGHVLNMQGNLFGLLYPYGRAHRMAGTPSYTTDLTWNTTIPLKGTLSLFVNLSVGNVFNNIPEVQGFASWSIGYNGAARRTWARDQKPSDDPLWGTYVAIRNYGPYYDNRGVDQNFGALNVDARGRKFSFENSLTTMCQFGFRF
jgi:hypothetical protein